VGLTLGKRDAQPANGKEVIVWGRFGTGQMRRAGKARALGKQVVGTARCSGASSCRSI
jgi:hypothetical protein